jgi:hypothetical protein
MGFAPAEIAPVHAHDCDDCRFLGIFYGADLYVCSDSYVARYSSEGPDYMSAGREVVRWLPMAQLPQWVQVAMAIHRVNCPEDWVE